MLKQKYFFASFAGHLAILLVLIVGFELTTPAPVIEQSSQHDVISAVILGDTEKSNILPTVKPTPPPAVITPDVAKNNPPPAPAPSIAIEDESKKLAAKKLAMKKQQALIEKQLLADIQKIAQKKKAAQQKQMQAQFAKTLKEQSEQTLRQHLLNEKINLQANKARYTHGVVSKYQALIVQAISENWIVPPQVNKKLSCELMIRLAPGGSVLDVQITKSSGDLALDRSARAAVVKASPLPVPSNADEFAPFKQFVLKVKPETLLAG